MLDVKKLVLEYGMNVLLKSMIDYLGTEPFHTNDQAKQLKKDLWTALENYDERYKTGYVKPVASQPAKSKTKTRK